MVRPASPARPTRALRTAALVAAWTVGAYWLFLSVRTYGHADAIGVDAHAYWLSAQQWGDLYSRRPGERDAFLYSPVFALAVHLLGWLSWPAFLGVWMVASTAVAWWLLRPLGAWAGPVLLLVSAQDVLLGNIAAFGAAALVLGLRSSRRSWHPALTALLPLTKVTTGLPLVWFLLRREWRALGVVSATVVGLSAASYVVVPGWWADWIRLLSDQDEVAAPWRFVVAGLLVVLGAVLDRKVLLAVALPLCLPVLGTIFNLAWIAGVPRLWRDDLDRRREAASPDLAATARPNDQLVPGAT